MEHCRHCPGPDDAKHQDPEFAKAEADCAFYEKPEHLAPAGPGRKLKRHAASLESWQTRRSGSGLPRQ